MRSLVEDEPKQIEIEIEPGATSLTLLQRVYRSPNLPLNTRLRAATAALPHEHPKLAVTAVVNEGDFAVQLDRAVERSRSAMIEAKPMANATTNDPSNTQRPHVQVSNGGGKPTILDRSYRTW